MTLKKGDVMVLLNDVTRYSVEHEFVEQYEVVEAPIYLAGIDGTTIAVRLKKVDLDD